MPTFDRIPSRPDPRRLVSFNLASLIDGQTPRSYTWPLEHILDQGEEGACVGHGITHEAVAKPKPVTFSGRTLPDWATLTVEGQWIGNNEGALAQAFAFDIYDQCRRTDEWPGEDYDGTSVAAGARAMKAAGLWESYRWTEDVEDFATAVSRHGPGVIGVDWYAGMMDTDPAGYIHPVGRVLGGHCIVVLGYNVARQEFTLANSWGTGWGRNGRAKIRKQHMAYLGSQGGEFLIPVHRML
jgi:hypothetical protein